MFQLFENIIGCGCYATEMLLVVVGMLLKCYWLWLLCY